MIKQTKTIDELKDSRLLYDKKVPELGYLIIIAIVFLLIIVLIWSLITPKIDIIKSMGTIQSTNKNYVMSPYMGKVTQLSISEGVAVEKGDLLFTVTSADYDLQGEQLKGKIALYEDRIEHLEILIRSIKDNKNYFDERVEADTLYFCQFESYQSQVEQQVIDVAAYKAYGYNDGQIENEVKKNQAKISEIYFSTLKGIEDSILGYKNELSLAQIQLDVIGSGQEEYQVFANSTGKIHMLMDYKEGMIIQAGGAVANISSENDAYKVQALIGADSVARVKVGDKVDLAIAGLTQSIYGTISGTVVNIDSDVTTDNDNNTSYFKVDINPDSTYLISKNGFKVNISNGMAVEARIQYDQVTYFHYVLESLGVLIR